VSGGSHVLELFTLLVAPFSLKGWTQNLVGGPIMRFQLIDLRRTEKRTESRTEDGPVFLRIVFGYTVDPSFFRSTFGHHIFFRGDYVGTGALAIDWVHRLRH